MIHEIPLGAFAGVLMDAKTGRMNIERVSDYDYDALSRLAIVRENMRKLSSGDMKLDTNKFTLDEYTKQTDPVVNSITDLLAKLNAETDSHVVVFKTSGETLNFFGNDSGDHIDFAIEVEDYILELNHMLDVIDLIKSKIS